MTLSLSWVIFTSITYVYPFNSKNLHSTLGLLFLVHNIHNVLAHWNMSLNELKTSIMFQDFLANLNPFPDMNCTEIDNYLWAKSSDLEKHCSDTQRKRPKEAERRWKSLDLRSPGNNYRSHSVWNLIQALVHAPLWFRFPLRFFL